MTLRNLFALGLVALLSGAVWQDGENARNSITADELKEHAVEMCTEMKGRGSASEGEKMVADYVAEAFESYGLKPAGEDGTYVQKFPALRRGRRRDDDPGRVGYNTFGFWEGADKTLKEEVVVIGAHMDAVGGSGADDNASGTSAVLELAQAVTQGKIRPKRSLLFCTWGSEEMWMVGSYHFVKNTTTIPLSRMKLYLNMDMIGRNDGEEKILGIAGSESADPPIRSTVQKRAKAVEGLKATLEDPMISPPGDVMPFYENGIPFLYFYTYAYGKMHPDYHRKSDGPEKLDYPSEEKVVRLVFDLMLDFANADELPQKIKKGYKFPHPLRAKPRKRDNGK